MDESGGGRRLRRAARQRGGAVSYKVYLWDNLSAIEWSQVWRLAGQTGVDLGECEMEQVREVLLRALPRDGLILDAGCGDGKWPVYLRRRGYRVIALDIAHEGVRTRILNTDMPQHVARVASFGPEEPKLLENYAPNVPVMTFQHGMTLHVGDHTFQMIHMPGHTLYQAAILIKEEGVVFTSDNIFYKVQTFIQEANPDQWLEALEGLRRLDEDIFVPGHGAVCDKSYLDEQGEYILEWKAYVQKAIDQGMTKDEAIEKLTAMTERYPMDVGLEGQAPRVMRMNVANLYDYLTGSGMHRRG